MSAGWTIRDAAEEDAPALAHLHIAGWRKAYGGIVDAAYLAALDETARAQSWRDNLSVTKARIAFAADGLPAGFVSYGKVRTPLPGQSPVRPLYTGEIYALYILPACQRQGLGKRLMAEAAAGLAGLKHHSLCLWVLEENRQAVSFYQSLDGQRCGKTMIEIGGGIHKEIAFGWRDTAQLRGPAAMIP